MDTAGKIHIIISFFMPPPPMNMFIWPNPRMLKEFVNKFKNNEKYGNMKSWNTKELLILVVLVCPRECGRGRETLQTTLESCILRFRKWIFFVIFKFIDNFLQHPWIWTNKSVHEWWDREKWDICIFPAVSIEGCPKASYCWNLSFNGSLLVIPPPEKKTTQNS